MTPSSRTACVRTCGTLTECVYPRMYLRSMLRSLIVTLMFVVPCLAVAQDPFGDSGSGGDPFSGGTDPFSGTASESSMDVFGAGADNPVDAGSPFDGGAPSAQPRGSAAPAAATSSSPLGDPDPVVRMLRANPPSTPEDVATAIQWMARLRRNDEIGRLLDIVATLGWDASQKAAMSRAVGPSLWIKLTGVDSELTEAQKTLVADIQRAPAQLARNPQWVDSWIARLGSQAAGERRMAQLRIQDAGALAAQRLVNQILVPVSPVDARVLAETALLFGQDGIDALRAGCATQNAEGLTRLYVAMVGLPGKYFTAEIAAGLYDQRLSEEQREQVAAQLQERYSKLPESSAVREYLVREFENRLIEYFEARANAGELQDRVWQTVADRSAVQSVEAPAEQRQLERLAQLAELAVHTGQLSRDDLVNCRVAMLQRSYAANPTLESQTSVSGEASDLDVDVFHQASRWHMHGAAVRALQSLAMDAGDNVETLKFLSELLDDSRPVIRFTALSTLAKIDPRQSYPGSDQAIRTALEMAKLGTGPHALVIGLQSDLRQAAKQQIEITTGAEVSTANSASTALQILNDTLPVEMIFVVDRVSDQSLFELLQRLRASKGGSAIPIAVTVENLYPHEQAWIGRNGGIVTSVLSHNSDHMQQIVLRLQAELDTQPLSVSDRAGFASVAGQFLARITSDPATYGFYHLGNFRKQLISTAAELTVDERIQMLSGIGTQESQFELVQLAGAVRLPDAVRLAAASGFAASVKMYGNQLGNTQARDVYEIYNRTGPTDSVAVQALGHILDVVEAQAGKREWPAALP